jgi:hypothetical protein
MAGKKKVFSKLSQYFLLYEDVNRADLEALEDYDLETTPVSDLCTGQKFDGDMSNIVFKLTEGNPTDTLGNPLAWPIYSTRCVKCLSPLMKPHVQVISLRVQLADSTIKHDRYQLVNPIGTVDAIHGPTKKKAKVSLVDMVLDAKAIPPDRHIFRLTHQEAVIVVSAAVAQRLSDDGMVGFACAPLDVV